MVDRPGAAVTSSTCRVMTLSVSWADTTAFNETVLVSAAPLSSVTDMVMSPVA